MKKTITWPDCSTEEEKKVFRAFERFEIQTKRKMISSLMLTREYVSKSEYDIKTDEAVQAIQSFIDSFIEKIKAAKLPSLKGTKQFYGLMLYNNGFLLDVETVEEITIEGTEVSTMRSAMDYEIFRYNTRLLTPKEYASLYDITEKKVEKLLNKGLFFSVKYINDQPLISELELPAQEEPECLFYEIPENANIECDLIPTIKQASLVIIKYDCETKKHEIELINQENEFKQSMNLNAKEACYIRRLLNGNEEIDTGELGRVIYLHL